MPIVCFSYDYLINNHGMSAKKSYANLPEKKKDFRKKIDKLVKDADHLKPNDWESEEAAYQAIKAEESCKFPTFREYSDIVEESQWGALGLMAAGPIIGGLQPITRMMAGKPTGKTITGGAPELYGLGQGKAAHWGDTAAAVGVPIAGMGVMGYQAQQKAKRQNAMMRGFCLGTGKDRCSETDIKRAEKQAKEEEKAKVNQAWQQNPRHT
jgi:hypothetical protein